MINVTLDIDTERDTSYFRYENPGLRELTFLGDITKIVGSSYSRTGYAFRQQEQNRNQFPIPICREVWVKFDWRFGYKYNYYSSYVDLRCYIGNKPNGFRLNYDAFNIWANNVCVKEFGKDVPDAKLHEAIVHYKVGKTDGVLELWLDGELKYSESNLNLNDGADISSFYIQGGSETWFSNVIISNRRLTPADNCPSSLKYWIQPKTSNKGTIGLDKFAYRAVTSDNYTNLTLFNNMEHINMGKGSEIIFFVKNPITLKQLYLSGSNGVPYKGIVQWSDYGDEWQTCGEWVSDSPKLAVANCYEYEPHQYYRIAPTENNPPNGNRRTFNSGKYINIVAELREPMHIISDNYDADRDVKYTYTLNGNYSYGYNTGVKINDDKKHRVILRSDGTNMQVYVDGVKCEKEIPVRANVSSYPITLGRKQDLSDYYADMNLYGARIYDRAITDAEIDSLSEDGLVAQYDHITSSTIIYDETGKGNNISVENGTMVEYEPRFRESLDFGAQRIIRHNLSLNFSTNRLIKGKYTNTSLDYDTLRKNAIEVSANDDTKVSIVLLFPSDIDTKRQVRLSDLTDISTDRELVNQQYLVIHANADARRNLSSVPTATYGVATCEEINLGDVYDIVPSIIIDGTAQAEMRTAYETHNYDNWKSYTPDKIACQYIQFRLRVNGYCRGAEVKITVPAQEETIAEEIGAVSTTIPFTNNYYKPPAIFPSYSGNTVVVERVTNSYCVVHLTNDSGQKVAGQVVLLVRG